MKNFIKSFRLTLVFCVFFSVCYILVLWIFAQFAGPNSGNAEVVELNGNTLTPSVGFTPWKGMYDADGAAFTDIALKASKNINITDHFSLPLFVQAIVSPSFDKTYLIAGLSIGF